MKVGTSASGAKHTIAPIALGGLLFGAVVFAAPGAPADFMDKFGFPLSILLMGYGVGNASVEGNPLYQNYF